MENLRNLVIKHINDLPEDEIIDLHNRYVDENSYSENVYQMEELDEILGDRTPTEIIQMLDNFSVNHDYFYLNDLDHLNSFDYINDNTSPINVEEMADWLINNNLLDELDGFCEDEEDEE